MTDSEAMIDAAAWWLAACTTDEERRRILLGVACAVWEQGYEAGAQCDFGTANADTDNPYEGKRELLDDGDPRAVPGWMVASPGVPAGQALIIDAPAGNITLIKATGPTPKADNDPHRLSPDREGPTPKGEKCPACGSVNGCFGYCDAKP